MSLDLYGATLLVVVAHPDDEVLGPGATVHRLVRRAGCTAHALVLGEGLTARADARDPDAWADALGAHRADAERAAQRIGYASIALHDFPDNRFDTVPLLDLVKVVERAMAAVAPDVVLTHHPGDLNIDHRRTCDAVLAAARPLPGAAARTILSFEVPSSTEWQAPTAPGGFRPTVFVACRAADVEAKAEAMACYRFEGRPFPHPRSPEALRALARWRGATSGTPFAEAFELVRGLVGEAS